MTGDLQSEVSSSLYDIPNAGLGTKRRSNNLLNPAKNNQVALAPGGVTAYNYYEETQIAKIYGMTEDYTPP